MDLIIWFEVAIVDGEFSALIRFEVAIVDGEFSALLNYNNYMKLKCIVWSKFPKGVITYILRLDDRKIQAN